MRYRKADFSIEPRAWDARRRHTQPPPIDSFTFGYLHPTGGCPHEPACSPPESKPFGGNDEGSRCKPQYKQSLAHASHADIMFYGGAVGGGKSEYGIVEAITLCLTYAGSKVAFFRRTLTQLQQEIEGRIILLSWADQKEFRGPNGKLFCRYAKQRNKFVFWNGSELHLCYCDHERDVYKYQGLQLVGLFIDESSHFTEFQVKYLITRVRSPKPGVPKVIRLMSNPGNVGHGWHKRWFIRPTPEELGGRPAPLPFEVWRPLPAKGDPTPPDRVATRQFIPAWFHDNIALATNDPDYLAKVYALGGDKSKQLAEGDWDANDSMIVGGHWRAQHLVSAHDRHLMTMFPHLGTGSVIPWHVVPDRSWRPVAGAHIFGSVDYGYGAPWAFHLHAMLPGGHIRTFYEDYGPRKTDQMQAGIIKTALERETFADGKTPLMEGVQWIVYDPSMKSGRTEMGLAKSIIEVYQDKNPRVQFVPGSGTRAARMSRPNRWMDALTPMADGLPGWSCTARCADLIRTVPEVPWDEKDPEVEDGKSENHAYEGVGRFFEARPFAPRQDVVDPYAGLDPLSRAHHQAQDKKHDDRYGEIPQLHARM